MSFTSVGEGDLALKGFKTKQGIPILEAYDKQWQNFMVRVDQGKKGKLPLAFPLKTQGSIVKIYNSKGNKELSRWYINASRGQIHSLSELTAPPPIPSDFSFGKSDLGGRYF